MALLAPIGAGLLVGSWRFGFLPSIPPFVSILLFNFSILVIVALVCWLNKTCRLINFKAHHLKLGFWFSLSVIVGFSWAYVHAQNYRNTTLPMWAKGPCTLKGQVVGVPWQMGGTWQFDLDLFEVCKVSCEKVKKTKVRCRFHQPDFEIKAQDVLTLQADLKSPHSLANPGGFDLEKQFFLENVHKTAWVQKIFAQKRVSTFSVDSFRENLALKMTDVLSNHRFKGVILALTLGIKAELSPEDKAVFMKTGTSHLMAISGLHIGLIAMVCFLLAKLGAKRFSKLILKAPASTYGAYFAFLGASGYAFMAGFSLPTQRALIMLSVLMGGWIFKSRLRSWDVFSLALIGVILYDPFAPLAVGFWLSFGAVFVLIYAYSDLGHSIIERKLVKWFLPQWIVFIGLMPFMAVFFHQLPLISPFANVIAIPIMSFVVVPLSVLGAMVLPLSMTLGARILDFAELAMGLLWPLLKGMANLPALSARLVDPSPLGIFLAVVGVLWLLAPKGWPNKSLGVICLLPLFFTLPNKPDKGSVRFNLLEVGQGLSVVIQTQNHVLLYDTGPTYGKMHNAGDRVILPFLRRQGINSIDTIILSHGDNDHIGGLQTILSEMPVKKLLTSEPARLLVPAAFCQNDEKWEYDGIQFEFLGLETKPKKSNNRSCVMQIVVGDKKILLTGDIENPIEQQLVKRYGARLASDILIAPHHGSLTSSSKAFISEVSPSYVLFATGKDNPWGFPKEVIQQRYLAQGARLLNTAETGAIKFTLFNNQISEPEIWRAKARRFWHSDT